MRTENRREEVPFVHYCSRFAALNPSEVTARLEGVQWDGKEFYVNLLGRKLAISHPDYALRAPEGGALPPLTVQTFLLRWLLEGRAIPATGAWKTFREMPWGELYIVPYTGRVLNRAAFAFGTRLAAFRAACEKLGGEVTAHGDAGCRFTLLPGYRMELLVWEGDDEFPPSAQLLYSDNFAAGFTAEDRVVAADILIAAIKGFM